MTPKEFFDKVVEMRRCQKEYFKNKRQIDLRISKQIEREVDEEIERVQKILHNKQYPYVEEVLEYVKEHTPDMFEPEGGYACMSLFHGLCE